MQGGWTQEDGHRENVEVEADAGRLFPRSKDTEVM